MTGPESIPLLVAAGATVIAAATDLRSFKVYNALTFPLILGGPLVSLVLGGWTGLQASLAGAALGFAVLVVCFALGGVGAGDVKLLTGLGAWLGPALTVQVFVASALAGGAYALGLLALSGGVARAGFEAMTLGRRLLTPGGWAPTEVSLAEEVRRPDRRRRLIPFAAMTCLGFFAVLFHHSWRADLVAVWPPYVVSEIGGTR